MNCAGCDEPLPDGSTRRVCSPTCRVRVWRRENPEKYRAQGRSRHARRYGTDAAYTAAQRAQNARYKAANRARCSERERLRQADIIVGGPRYLERVDRDTCWAMHGGRCGICGEFVPQDEFVVDHVIPLSRGGLHGYVNTQPAHPLCNNRKYNHLPDEVPCFS